MYISANEKERRESYQQHKEDKEAEMAGKL